MGNRSKFYFSLLETSVKNPVLDYPFPKKLYGTIGFQLGDGMRCLESEAQNTELSLEVAKIQFSLSGF